MYDVGLTLITGTLKIYYPIDNPRKGKPAIIDSLARTFAPGAHNMGVDKQTNRYLSQLRSHMYILM